MGLPLGARLMLGNGSDELIHLVIQACARPGAVILSPWPSFSMYEVSTRFDGCRFVGVPLRADFTLDANAVLSAIAEHQPAVIFIAYPNNPTGNLFDRNGVEAILRAAPGLVVIDEAYLPFAQDTWMPQLRNWPNLAVLRTLSKLGLAGIRLGYLAGDPEWIDEFDKLRPPYNVNVLTLAAADFLLEHLPALESQAVMLRAERSRVAAALSAMRGVTVFPSAANFLLFRLADADRVFNTLKERGILIKNVSAVHPLLQGCLRTTIGTGVENDALMQALRAIMEGQHEGNADPCRDRSRRQWTLPGVLRNRVLRSHAGSAGPPRHDGPRDRCARRPAHRRSPHDRGHRHHAGTGVRAGGRRQGRRAPLWACLRAAR
jgi:histidinol-phosphate aminotransferase